MELYQKLYVTLFNACTDAVELLESHRMGEALVRLKQAQEQTEEMYMDYDGGE